MISFECQHCGNHMTIDARFAGRDGWCRVCKKMIIFPREDGVAERLESLSLEEAVRRMYKLIRYAATRADDYKLQALEQRDARDREREALEARVAGLTEEVRVRERALAKARDAAAAPAAADEAEGLSARNEALAAEQARLAAENQQLTTDLAEARGEQEALRARLTEAREASDAGESDLLQENEALRVHVTRLEESVSVLDAAREKLAAELHAALGDAAGAREALEEARANAARMTVEAEAAAAAQAKSEEDARVAGKDAEAARAELRALQGLLEESKAARAAAQQDAERAGESIAEYEDTVAGLERQLSELNGAQASLVARLSAFEAEAMDARDLGNQVQALEERIQRLLADNTGLSDALEDALERARAAEMLAEAQGDELEQSAEELAAARDETARERQERVRVEDALSDAALELQRLRDAAAEGEAEADGEEDGYPMADPVAEYDDLEDEDGDIRETEEAPPYAGESAAPATEQAAMMNAFRRFLDRE